MSLDCYEKKKLQKSESSNYVTCDCTLIKDGIIVNHWVRILRSVVNSRSRFPAVTN